MEAPLRRFSCKVLGSDPENEVRFFLEIRSRLGFGGPFRARTGDPLIRSRNYRQMQDSRKIYAFLLAFLPERR